MHSLKFILFILALGLASLVHARTFWGLGSSYQINQMNQIMHNMYQLERMNQNIHQMNQMNQLLEINHLDRMSGNLVQKNQIDHHINNMNQMNQLLNMQILLQKKAIASKPATKKNKQAKHK